VRGNDEPNLLLLLRRDRFCVNEPAEKRRRNPRSRENKKLLLPIHSGFADVLL
jgi:hypothetical protein